MKQLGPKERDNAIQRCVGEFGPVTREQLMALCKVESKLGAACTLWRRLLFSKPLVASRRIFVWKGNENEKNVYATYDISKRKDLEHDLITSWVHITLYKNFNLAYWKRAKEKQRGHLNEDAFFVLRLPQGEVHYFLESDTGSEGFAQIENKLERYLDYYRKEEKAFFVLFVCADAQRAKELAKRASRAVPREKRKLYLFTCLESLTSDPTGQICHVAHEGEKYSILPVC